MKHFSSALCPIFLNEDFDALQAKLESLPYSTAFIIADTNTSNECVPVIKNFIPRAEIITIPAGEQNKNLHQCEKIWAGLLDHGADRKSILLNVGGGMICDLGGFAASCFQRGIRFIHIPTSVLAMADASIGGKLGVDFQHYKNYIGLFRHPEFIWMNTIFLQTLPDAEKNNGLVEIIKHAIIGSKELWKKLNDVHDVNDIDWAALLEVSISIKVNIVEKDQEDRAIRKTLNFGHTIGHAIESYFLTKSTPLSHGQAVALGMMAESHMALNEGLLNKNTFEKIIELISRLIQLPTIRIPTTAELMPLLSRDKKVIDRKILFSLPDEIGSCKWDVPAAPYIGLDWLREQSSMNPFH